MPKFSVIIPVYNVDAYLKECVGSVLAQSFTDFEVILINDGSTDNSGPLCDKFAFEDKRVQVIHQKNCGLSAARNAGIMRASGEYILFLDSDDFWVDENVLNILFERLQKTHAQVLSFNYVKVEGAYESKPYFQSSSTMPETVADSFQYQINHDLWIACAWNKVIQSNLFGNGALRFVEGITAEDIDWCVRLALAAEKFDYISNVLVCYRIRGESISKNVTVPKAHTLLDNIDTCTTLLQQAEDTSKAEMLKSFVGFQYGTVLFRLAVLKKDVAWQSLLERAKKSQYLLKCSNHKKIKLMSLTTSVGGLRLTLFLLGLLYNR